jgi:hypothetical protein
VVARIAKANYTTMSGSLAPVPLDSGATWPQAANEVQELFELGTVKITNAPGSNCVPSGPPVGIQLDLSVDGAPAYTHQFAAPAPGNSTTSTYALTGPSTNREYPEPGSSSSHNATVQIADNCPGTDHLTVDFTFDVLGFR